MGYMFDSAGVSTQSSTASAGRLDSANEFQAGGGGAGPRNSILQNFSFGQSKLNADQSAVQEQLPWWVWLLGGVGLLLVLAKIFKGRT
jgi:hypothetical protein